MSKRRLATAVGVGIVFAVGAIALSVQASEPTYSLGTVTVSVPAPAGLVEAFSSNPRLRELFAGPGPSADVLAGYVSPMALLSFEQTGQSEELEFAVLGTSRSLRGVDVGQDTFAALAIRLRTGLGDAINRNERDMATFVVEMGRRMGANVEPQAPTPVGIFDDGPDRIGSLLVTRFTFNGSSTTILSANTLLRIRSRLLFAYVYTRNLQPEGTAALTSAARSWTDAIFQANRQPTPGGQ